MATINRTTKKDELLTILTVIGFLTCDEVLRAIEDFYKHDVTPYLLWDFRQADVSGLTQGDIGKILSAAISNAHLRKNGRTAFVGHQDLPFGMSRMYETLSEISDHPIPPRVFRDMDKALTWLKGH